MIFFHLCKPNLQTRYKSAKKGNLVPNKVAYHIRQRPSILEIQNIIHLADSDDKQNI